MKGGTSFGYEMETCDVAIKKPDSRARERMCQIFPREINFWIIKAPLNTESLQAGRVPHNGLQYCTRCTLGLELTHLVPLVA